MTKIGVLSDTHGVLDPKISEFFSDCNQIWHAGDIGSADIITDLQTLTSQVHAVYGNIDDWEIRSQLPEYDFFTVEQKKVLITHICGTPLKYNTQVRRLILEHRPDILVCGHSHILKVQFDKNNNLLFMNPGAAGFSGFHKVRTALRFYIDGQEIKNLEVLELSKLRIKN